MDEDFPESLLVRPEDARQEAERDGPQQRPDEVAASRFRSHHLFTSARFDGSSTLVRANGGEPDADTRPRSAFLPAVFEVIIYTFAKPCRHLSEASLARHSRLSSSREAPGHAAPFLRSILGS